MAGSDKFILPGYSVSLNSKSKLIEVAKVVCRELRKNPTPAERILWKAVRNRTLLNKKFYRQYPIFHDLEGKESFFVADFYCYENKIIVELDGRIHDYQLTKDKKRTEVLNDLGLSVIRFSNFEVEHNFKSVLLELKDELEKTRSGFSLPMKV